MSHNRKDMDFIVSVLDTFLFPVFRIGKILFSDRTFKEHFSNAKGQVIYDLFATAFLGAVVYYLGRITLFGHQFTYFWGAGGVLAGILLLSFLIGFLRKKVKAGKLQRAKTQTEDEPSSSKAILLTPEQWDKIIQANPNILADNPQLRGLK